MATGVHRLMISHPMHVKLNLDIVNPKPKMIKTENKKPIYYSLAVSSVLFVSFFLFANPVYNSDDDFYFLYTLAGGHIAAPTNTLHYMYSLNPIITYFIAKLFAGFPHFNWYSFFLVSVHFVSCFYLLFSLQKHYKTPIAIFSFLVFFVCIESRLLLSLNYSSTAVISSFAGLVPLILAVQKNSPRKISLVIPLLFILLSGLIRVHILGLNIILVGPFLLLSFSFRNVIRLTKLLSLTFLVLILAVLCQVQLYENQIKNWQQEENLRQSFFHSYNRPYDSSFVLKSNIGYVKSSLIQSLLIYDSTFTTAQDIAYYNDHATRTRGLRFKEDKEALHWTYINNRAYLLLILPAIAFCVFGSSLKNIFPLVVTSLFCASVLVILFLYFKITEAIFYASLATVFFTFLFCIHKFKVNAFFLKLFLLPVVLSMLWQILLIKKQSDKNVLNINEVRGALTELKQNPKNLYISAGVIFPYQSFSIWDCPRNYPAKNLIYKELILTNTAKQILQSFHLQNVMRQLPIYKNVYLLGDSMPPLQQYYLQRFNLNTKIEKVPNYKYLHVWQVCSL